MAFDRTKIKLWEFIRAYPTTIHERLTLLVKYQCLREPVYDGHFYKTDILICPEGCPSEKVLLYQGHLQGNLST